MEGLIFLKLKRGMWFAACFMIILLFCSIPMKHFFDNYVIAAVALILSLAIVPIYAYIKRRKNGIYKRLFFSVKYGEEDTPLNKLKLSPLFIHLKVEAGVSAFYSVILVAGACYYLCKGMGIGITLLIWLAFTAVTVSAIIALDIIIWLKTFSYWESNKKKNGSKKLG